MIYRELFNASPDILLLYSPDGCIVDCNENACRVFGYTKQEMRELTHKHLVPEDFAHFIPDIITEKDTTNGIYVWRSARKKDGTIFPVEYSSKILTVNEERYVSVCIRMVDETEKTNNESRSLIIKTRDDAYYRSSFTVTLSWLKRDEDFILIGYDTSAEKSTQGRVANFLGWSAAELYVEQPNIVDDLALCMRKKSMVKRYKTAYRRFTTGEKRLRDITYIFVFPDIVVAHMEDITEQEFAEKQLAESEKNLRILSSKLFTAKEEERKRISQELHDGIGQYLTGIKFNLEKNITQMRRGDSGESLDAIEQTVFQIQDAVDEVRKTCMELWPSTLSDLGILATISWLCRECMEHRSRLSIVKDIDISEDHIPEAVKIPLFRIVQESLNNIVKHSNAVHVSLVVKKKDGGIELIVSDDGVGFNVDDVIFDEERRKGLGLASIRERASTSGGKWFLDSFPGRGTTVRVIWGNPS